MKRLLSVFLAFVIAFSVFFSVPINVFAKEIEVIETSNTSGDYTYAVLTDGTAEITDYTGLDNEITVPSTLDGYKITSISGVAFYGSESLTSVTIPDSVTSMGKNPFAYCKNLSAINVDSNNQYYDSRDNCNAIIETASNSLVSGCKNTVIPSSVTSIDEAAFFYCTGLTSIIVSEGVTSIGNSAFCSCENLVSVTIIGDLISIGDEAFAYCGSLKSIVIPDSVTSIGECAFVDCGSLALVKMPDNLTSIGRSAFAWCKSLKSITIPKGVTSIVGYVFVCCLDLESITIPKGMTSVGRSAFECCESLKNVFYDGGESQWNDILIGVNNEHLTNATIHYNYMLGNIDGDGDITIMDATAIQLHIAQLCPIPDERLECGDTDKDGEVSIMDATQIQLFIAQLIPSL